MLDRPRDPRPILAHPDRGERRDQHRQGCPGDHPAAGARKGSRLMLTLAITAGALALALVGVLILAIVTGVF